VDLGKDSPDRQNNYKAPWTTSLRLTIRPNHSASKRMQNELSQSKLPAGAFRNPSGASMKYASLLLTSSLVIASSGAFAQGNTDACHNSYGSCMERCSSRPAAVQESCSNSCEANTNQCYSQIYGPRSGAQSIPSAAEQSSAQDSEAQNARNEAKPAAKSSKKR
jgi:hypothetical protein